MAESTTKTAAKKSSAPQYVARLKTEYTSKLKPKMTKKLLKQPKILCVKSPDKSLLRLLPRTLSLDSSCVKAT